MIVVPVYSLVFLVLTMGARCLSRPFVVKNIRRIFGTAVVGMVGVLAVLSGLQYSAWAAGSAPTKFLLAPHYSHWYFLQYVGWRFWAPYFIALLLGAIIGLLAHWYNKRHGGDLLYDDEPYLIALAIFLVGQPGWIVYFFGMLLLALLVHLGIATATWLRPRRFATTEYYRFSLYDFWLPVAAFVILIMQWLLTMEWFLLLKP